MNEIEYKILMLNKKRSSDPEAIKDRLHRSYLKHKKARLDKKLIEKYGIDASEYERLNSEQGGVCAICHQTCTCGRRLAVDHNHTTGAVRGLLCSRCNRGLGLFMESRGVLESALAYLAKHDAK